jgi:hypothetical protein
VTHPVVCVQIALSRACFSHSADYLTAQATARKCGLFLHEARPERARLLRRRVIVAASCHLPSPGLASFASRLAKAADRHRRRGPQETAAALVTDGASAAPQGRPEGRLPYHAIVHSP